MMAHCITPQPPNKTEVPLSVIKNTRSVLLSSIKGVPLKRFCRDYKSLVGEEFPWRKLGFSSASSLLHAMTEVVRFEFSQKDGNYRLYGIAGGMVYTPSWFVKAQGNITKKGSTCSPSDVLGTRGVELTKKGVVRSPLAVGETGSTHSLLSAVGGTGGVELTYNALGLVTVFVTWSSCTGERKEPLKDRTAITQKIRSMMERAGHPVEVLVHHNGHGFVRFASLEEAQKAISLCHNSVIDGLTFRVMPAKENMPRGRMKPNVRRQKQQTEQAWSKKLGPAMQTRVPQVRPNSSYSCVSDPPANSSGDVSEGIEPPWELSVSLSSELYDQERERDHDRERGSRGLLPNDKMDFQSVSDSTSESSWDDELLLIPIPIHRASNMMNLQHVTADMLTTDHATIDIDGRRGELEWSDSGSVRSEEGGNTSQGNIQGDGSGVTLDGAHARQSESCDQQFPWHLSPLNVPNENGLTPVRVSEVESSDQVWLQLSHDPEGDLEKLSIQITTLGSQRLSQVCVGDVCCMRLPNSYQFRRVRVEELGRESSIIHEQTKVLWIDTGSTHLLPTPLLHSLPPQLGIATIPPLAIPARLSAIVSTHGDRRNWFPLDSQLLWKHIHHKKVYAKFVQSPTCLAKIISLHQHRNHGNRLGLVDLYFDPEGLDRVADVLVREGFYVEYETVPNGALVERPLDGIQQSSKDQFASSYDNCHVVVSEGSSSSEEATGSIQNFSPWHRMQQALKLISDSQK